MLPKINSSHGSDTRNIINAAIDSINTQGKSIQDLVAEGQLTPAQYAHLLKEVNGLISKGEVKLDDLDPTVLEAINNADGTPFEILSIPRDKSVSPDKTTFADDGKIGGLVRGIGVPGGEGSAIFSDGDNRTSYVAEVKGGGTYTVKVENSPLFRLVTSKGYPQFGEQPNRYMIFNDNLTEYTLTLQDDENYIVLYVSSNADLLPTYAKIQEGTEITDDVEINLKDNSVGGSKLKNKSISPEKTTFAREGLPVSDLIEGLGVTGGIEDRQVTIGGSSRHSYIAEIEPNTTYAIERVGGNFFQISTTEAYPVHGLPATVFPNEYNNRNDWSVTTPPGAKYMIMYLSNDPDDLPTHILLQKGSKISEGAEFDIQDGTIPISKLESDIGGNRVRDRNLSFVTDHVSGNFKKNTPLKYVIDDFLGKGISSVYDVWDGFVEHSPDYVKKEHMWDEPVEGLPVHKYTFTPPQPVGNGRNDIQNIRILILGNVHGHETYGALGLANMFDDIVKHWKENDVLSMLRWNITFDVFPIYNPWGVQHYSRVNGNGVDLNSNLTHLWEEKDEIGSNFYSGPHAMSEYENKQFDAYLDSLPYSYDFAIDMHHAGAYDGTRVVYSRTLNDDVTRILFGVANQMTGILKRDYPQYFDDDNSSEIALYPPQGTGTMFQFFEYKKIPGTLHEIAFPGDIIGSDDTVNISINHLGNLLLSAVRNIDSIKLIE